MQATGNPVYQAFAAEMMLDVNDSMRVPGGWASVGSVIRDSQGRMPLEDIQPSYWLAEAALYLYLTFANDTILHVSISPALSATHPCLVYLEYPVEFE